MEIPLPRIDGLLRKAVQEKRLIQFVYKNKPRIVEPHDYGIHKGSVKLFGFQVGGLSSEPLPNWRWALVNAISDLTLLDRTFPGWRPSPSGKHHHWDQIFIRVEPAAAEALASAQRCGNSSSSLGMGNSAIRESTSRNQANGSIFTSSQEVTKLRSTAAVLPPRSLPKKVQLARPTAKQRSARSV